MSTNEKDISQQDDNHHRPVATHETTSTVSTPVVVVIGAGIAGVSFAESLAALCPNVRIEIVSASPLLKVASNVRQTGLALEEFDVTEQPKSFLESTYSNTSVIFDVVRSVDIKHRQLDLTANGKRSYSYLCVCTGGRPHLIPGSNEYVIGIRDTETVKDLQRRLTDARRIIVVGNGGIATELVYEVDKCQVVWAIKDKSIGNTFFDAVAARFFTPRLTNIRNEDMKTNEPSKRLKYIVDKGGRGDDGTATGSELGRALGPDWVSALSLTGSASKNVIVEYETDVKAIYRSAELTDDKKSRIEKINQPHQHQETNWPVYVELSNGKIYGCDFVVSATGVSPNSEIIAATGADLAEDGGLKVNKLMQTTVSSIYAAGDVCLPNWEFAEHWFPMKLWTQARQMGIYAAYCVAANFINDLDPLFHFQFEVFTHVTKFFGYKVIMLGLFNGQKLNNKYEALYRVSDEEEYVKVLLKDGKMKGAVLIGETDLEETFENLIHNQIDLSRYGEDLLNPSVDIEDYFD